MEEIYSKEKDWTKARPVIKQIWKVRKGKQVNFRASKEQGEGNSINTEEKKVSTRNLPSQEQYCTGCTNPTLQISFLVFLPLEWQENGKIYGNTFIDPAAWKVWCSISPLIFLDYIYIIFFWSAIFIYKEIVLVTNKKLSPYIHITASLFIVL